MQKQQCWDFPGLCWHASSCPSAPGAPGSLTLPNLNQNSTHKLFCTHYQLLPWCCSFSTLMRDFTKVLEVDSQSRGQLTPRLNSNDIFDFDGKDIFLTPILMKPRSGLFTIIHRSCWILSLKALKNRLCTLCRALFSSSWGCPGADPHCETSQCSLLPYY